MRRLVGSHSLLGKRPLPRRLHVYRGPLVGARPRGYNFPIVLENGPNNRSIHEENKRARNQGYKPSFDRDTVIVTLPNLITVARMLSSPLISYLIIDEQWSMAISGLCVAGASDWLDGYIARNYGQQSALGSILDPLADKVLVAAVAVPLAIQGSLPPWLVALMLGRDIGLVAGVMLMRSAFSSDLTAAAEDEEGRRRPRFKKIRDIKKPPIDPDAPFEFFEIRPTLLSKANTALQVNLLGFTMMSMAWQIPSCYFIDPLTGAVAVTTVVSGVDYYLAARKHL